MIPGGTDEEARAIMALAEARIEALGPRRFGAEWGIQASAWWTVHHLAESGYAAAQIVEVIDERVAGLRDGMVADPTDNAQLHLVLWIEIRAAITTTCRR